MVVYVGITQSDPTAEKLLQNPTISGDGHYEVRAIFQPILHMAVWTNSLPSSQKVPHLRVSKNRSFGHQIQQKVPSPMFVRCATDGKTVRIDRHIDESGPTPPSAVSNPMSEYEPVVPRCVPQTSDRHLPMPTR